MPTTVQRSPPKASSPPRATPLNSVAMPFPTTTSWVPNWKGRPWTIWTPGRSSDARGRHASNRHVPERVALLLVEVDDEDYFPRQERATFGPPRHAALRFEHVRRGPVDLTRELGRGRAPEHDHVVGRARLDEGRFQTPGEHEHAGEDEHHERDAADRERRGEAAGPEAPPDIRERDPHHGRAIPPSAGRQRSACARRGLRGWPRRRARLGGPPRSPAPWLGARR